MSKARMAELDKLANELTTEVALLQRVVQCLVNQEPRDVERFSVEHCSFKLSLYRAAAPDGGILLMTVWTRAGRTPPHTSAYYFEDFRSRDHGSAHHLKAALERLYARQQEMLDLMNQHA